MGVTGSSKMTGVDRPAQRCITKRNQEAQEDPYQVNQDPYGKGWLCSSGARLGNGIQTLITGKAVKHGLKEMELRSQGWID